MFAGLLALLQRFSLSHTHRPANNTQELFWSTVLLRACEEGPTTDEEESGIEEEKAYDLSQGLYDGISHKLPALCLPATTSLSHAFFLRRKQN